MKIKRFNENTTITQQPFYLRKSDYLYISDDLAKSMTPTVNDMIKKGWRYEYTDQRNKDFLNNTKETNERGFTYYKSSQITTLYQVRYNGMHGMTISIRRGTNFNNEFGNFQYLIGGISGDHEMHGKNMVRATRECNLNLMIKLYPIVEHIKNFYKIFKTGEKSFFDIIKEAILKDLSLVKHGVPSELENDYEVGHYASANKYNI